MNNRYRNIFIIVLAIFTVAPLLAGTYSQHLGIMVFIDIILAVSLGFLIKNGLLSLGHAAYAGIGAYCSAILVIRLGVPVWISIAGAMAISAVFAYVLGRLTLGLKGIYFTITTFAFGEIFVVIYNYFDDIFGGATGLTNIPPPGGLSTMLAFYYAVMVMAALTFLFFFKISEGRIGLFCNGISDSQGFMESVGINTMKMKVNSFMLASAFAGLAGALKGSYLGFISPVDFEVITSIDILVYCIIGGMGSITGAAMGAILMSIVGQMLYAAQAYKTLIFGLFLIFVILVIPEGLSGLSWEKVKRYSISLPWLHRGDETK